MIIKKVKNVKIIIQLFNRSYDLDETLFCVVVAYPNTNIYFVSDGQMKRKVGNS